MPAIDAKKMGKRPRKGPATGPTAARKAYGDTAETVSFKLIRSAIGATPSNMRTLISMSLGRTGRTTTLPNNDVTWGQAAKVWPYLELIQEAK